MKEGNENKNKIEETLKK